MDIFTTALTRYVPVPIKPSNFKVKALEKLAVANKVADEEHDEDNREVLFNKPIEEKSSSQQEADDKPSVDVEASPVPGDKTGQHIDIFDDSDDSEAEITQDKDGKPHLDLFV